MNSALFIKMQQILHNFPNIELSYEKILHKKIHKSDFYLTIPKGPKYFAWFQHYRGQPVCYFLKLYRRKQIETIEIRLCCFHESLCMGLGTILYGTIFLNNKCFNVEDIFYFKNRDISHYNQKEKFNTIYELFNENIKQLNFGEKCIVFSLPLMDTNYNNLIIRKMPYELYCIQHRSIGRGRIYLNEKLERDNQYAIFLVKSSLETDIYDLFCRSDGYPVKYGIANIPDYKTSVLMNSLFRNIKENRNLDLLEESDSEDEFEDINIGRFVYLDKMYYIKCVYNNRYKRWTPLKVIETKISSKKEDILLMEKK